MKLDAAHHFPSHPGAAVTATLGAAAGTGVFEPWLQELWKQPTAQARWGPPKHHQASTNYVSNHIYIAHCTCVLIYHSISNIYNMYMYMCIYTYTYIHIYRYIYIYIHICQHTFLALQKIVCVNSNRSR